MPSRLREESMLADRGAGPLRVGEEARDDGAEGVVKPLGIQREGMLLYIYIRFQVKMEIERSAVVGSRLSATELSQKIEVNKQFLTAGT